MDAPPGGVAARLAEYERLAEDVRAMRDGLDRIRAAAYSPDGLVSVTVGGRGELLDLTLDPRIYRDQDAGALAGTITETVRDAVAKAERAAVRITERLVGDRTGGGVDPLFDPVLHVLDGERERGDRLWPT
jgi:DNA-binding protein YbaB